MTEMGVFTHISHQTKIKEWRPKHDVGPSCSSAGGSGRSRPQEQFHRTSHHQHQPDLDAENIVNAGLATITSRATLAN